ncbi:transcriptional regulator [Luteibacter sp. CQ10]|uniref:transcriptional regulator n=1 Tax=Luteibacter sp. CQ10 TaxID=2805821 RepID=UPI0034A40086
MKSQDLLLLLKIASLTRPETPFALRTEGWQDWERLYDPDDSHAEAPAATSLPSDAPVDFSVRGLALSTGISKSQVSISMRHCIDIGLMIAAREGAPSVNRRGLFEFLVYGARYVFPVRPGAPTRGIATGVSAPVFQGKLYTAADSMAAQVWPDPRGNTMGQAVTPLSASVPFAVRQDPTLYALLALLDAIRLGAARERGIAERELRRLLSIRE